MSILPGNSHQKVIPLNESNLDDVPQPIPSSSDADAGVGDIIYESESEGSQYDNFEEVNTPKKRPKLSTWAKWKRTIQNTTYDDVKVGFKWLLETAKLDFSISVRLFRDHLAWFGCC